MIMSDRDVFLGVHVTQDVKDALKKEADRRRTAVSPLVYEILEQWLIAAPDEQVEEVRSNKRAIKDPLRDIPLPLEGEDVGTK